MNDCERAIDPSGAIKSFFADPDWRVKTALGATFNALSLVLVILNQMLIPLAFVLWALVSGYMMRIIRTKVADPQALLPIWNDWVDLLISGLTWIAVYTGFVMFVVTIPTVGMLIGAAQGSMFAPDPRFVTWATTTFTLTFVLGLFVWLITTFLQANMAVEEKTAAAFAIHKVARRLRKRGGPLVQSWLLSIGILVLSVVVPSVTIIGIFLLPTVVFVGGAISAAIVAQAWVATED